jgi:hypothetical protein
VYLAGFRCKEYQDAWSEKHNILGISNAQPVKYFATNVFAIRALIHLQLFTRGSTAADTRRQQHYWHFSAEQFPNITITLK